MLPNHQQKKSRHLDYWLPRKVVPFFSLCIHMNLSTWITFSTQANTTTLRIYREQGTSAYYGLNYAPLVFLRSLDDHH